MEKLVLSKSEQLIKMECAYTRLSETISKQSEEVTKLSNTLLKRSSNIKIKGSDYEEEFYEKLKRAYGLCRGFQLKDTRSRWQSCHVGTEKLYFHCAQIGS